jgi:hypothetical protein
MARAWEYWTMRLEKSGEMPKSGRRGGKSKTQTPQRRTAKSRASSKTARTRTTTGPRAKR